MSKVIERITKEYMAALALQKAMHDAIKIEIDEIKEDLKFSLLNMEKEEIIDLLLNLDIDSIAKIFYHVKKMKKKR